VVPQYPRALSTVPTVPAVITPGRRFSRSSVLNRPPTASRAGLLARAARATQVHTIAYCSPAQEPRPSCGRARKKALILRAMCSINQGECDGKGGGYRKRKSFRALLCLHYSSRLYFIPAEGRTADHLPGGNLISSFPKRAASFQYPSRRGRCAAFDGRATL
jgi:hypothetical protein